MIDLLFLLSIVFFFVLLFCLGFTLLHIFPVKLGDDVFVRFLVYVGSGLGSLVALLVVFDLVGIPLRWWIFLLLSLVCPLYFVSKRGLREEKYMGWKREYWNYLVLILGVLLLGYVFFQGAYGYPYLEDDDPWGHAIAVAWVADTGSYHQEIAGGISHYLEPYPPSYDVILSFPYQINGTIFDTLKIFNIILLLLGLLFYFVFVKETFGIKVGVVATLVLIALPSWASHFIWSHTLALVLFPITMFAAIRAFTDKKWMWPAIILVAAMMVTHPFVSVVFGVFYIVFVLWQLIFACSEHKENIKIVFTSWNPFTQSFVVGLFGLLLGCAYWVQQLVRHGLNAVLYSHTGGFGGVAQVGDAQTTIEQYINPAYTLSDLLFPEIFAPIDQAVGFGLMAFLLVVCGVLFILWNWKQFYSREKVHLVVLIWFVLGFMGLMGGHLPFSILTHRFWAYVSIPFAIIVGVFIVFLLESLWKRRLLFVIAFVVLFIGVFGVPFTTNVSEDSVFGQINAASSWQPKKISATLPWPPGVAWDGIEELEGYMWMHDSIIGSYVLSLCQEERLLFGFDLVTHFPHPKIDAFRASLGTQSFDSIVSLGTSYEYVSLEYSCVSKGYISDAGLQELANDLATVWEVVYQNDAMVVYRVS
jgi:hypothetical protein